MLVIAKLLAQRDPGITKHVRPDEQHLKSVARQVQVAFVFAGVAYKALGDVSFRLKTSPSGDTGQLASRRP